MGNEPKRPLGRPPRDGLPVPKMAGQKGDSKMKEHIENCIKNLKQTLSWKEDELEKSWLGLVERASKCSAAEIAHGWLESDIGTIGREVEEVKSLREQIALLEHILKNVE